MTEVAQKSPAEYKPVKNAPATDQHKGEKLDYSNHKSHENI